MLFVAWMPAQEPWDVPTKYIKMANPTEVDDSENQLIGKQLYMKHCKSCHGKTGLGDGPKAKELDTPSGDFSSADFQAQPDGALFYKTTFGRDDMPAYDKKITSDEDRWLVVNYMRTLSK
ncbi:MAG: cytochrome c [Cyclobacteriaceae bacterium]